MAPEIQPSRVLRYMGTDLQGTPTAPRNLPEVRAAVWKQLHRPAALPGRGHDGAHGEAPE